MTKTEARIFNFINLFIIVTSIIYFIYKYFFKVTTDYGVRPHALTGTWLNVHILAVPFLIFIVSAIFKDHALAKIKSQSTLRQMSGWSLLLLFPIMVFSGYLLQMGIRPEVNSLLAYIHIAFSALWTLFSLWHMRLHFR
jgi:hypothetical protein